MAVAPYAAQAEAEEGRAVLDLLDGAKSWLNARQAIVVARNPVAHRAQDEDRLDARLADAVAVVQELAEREILRRRALSRFEALDTGALIAQRGPPPAMRWFVMYALGYLAFDAHDMMLVEALAAPSGINVRNAPTWWQDPDAALESWTKAVNSVSPPRT